ncbi:hypothetical protein Tco_0229754, partial [Tanacetum coccineum]
MAGRRHEKRVVPQAILILRAKSNSIPCTLGREFPYMSVIRQVPGQRLVTSPIRYHSLLVAGRYFGKQKGHRSKILPQQIGVIRGTQILNYQELRMTSPASELITSLNRVTRNSNNNDHSPSLQDKILNHISSLETLIKEYNEKAGTLITPIRLT